MTDKPIIFSAPMVRALLDGRKTQTRRIIQQPDMDGGERWVKYPSGWVLSVNAEDEYRRRIFYAPGDRLWVREHWRCSAKHDATAPRDLTPRGTTVFYECGGSASTEIPAGITRGGVNFGPETGERWIVDKSPAAGQLPPYTGRFRQAMHMPRWSSRLTLTITDVRVQRLQYISAADAIAEGVQCGTCEAMNQSACHGRGCFASSGAYRDLWNSLHGPGAWDANPWVVALTFSAQRGNIDQLPGVAE